MRTVHLIAAAVLVGACALVSDAARAQGLPDAMTKPGTHLVLRLDTAEVTGYWLGSMRDEIRGRLRKAKLGFGGLAVADGVVRVRLAKPEDGDAALAALADLAPTAPSGLLERMLARVRGASGSDVTVAKGEGGIITIAPTEAGLERRVSAALDDAVAIAGRRLEGMRVMASAVRQGRDRIHVHAPPEQDGAVLKQLLAKPARLGFHEVHASLSAEQARQGRVPTGYRIYSAPWGELLLREAPFMRGNDLADAQPVLDQNTREPILTFRFNTTGAQAFARFTSENVGRPIAIVLDDAVLSAPVIREPILGGSGQVSGDFTLESAKELAVQLRAGTLPAGITVIEERVVPGR